MNYDRGKFYEEGYHLRTTLPTTFIHPIHNGWNDV